MGQFGAENFEFLAFSQVFFEEFWKSGRPREAPGSLRRLPEGPGSFQEGLGGPRRSPEGPSRLQEAPERPPDASLGLLGAPGSLPKASWNSPIFSVDPKN